MYEELRTSLTTDWYAKYHQPLLDMFDAAERGHGAKIHQCWVSICAFVKA